MMMVMTTGIRMTGIRRKREAPAKEENLQDLKDVFLPILQCVHSKLFPPLKLQAFPPQQQFLFPLPPSCWKRSSAAHPGKLLVEQVALLLVWRKGGGEVREWIDCLVIWREGAGRFYWPIDTSGSCL